MDLNTCLATTDPYRALALYSHLIPALATLILGTFAFWRAQNRQKAAFFFGFSLAFAAWLFGDLIVWTSNPYSVVAAFWAPLDFIEISFFLLLFGFIFTDLYTRSFPRWLALLLLSAAAVPFFFTVTGQSVHEFYQPECEMLNNRALEVYKLILESVVLCIAFILGVLRIITVRHDRKERTRVALITTAVVLFMGIFGVTEYIANTTYVYETHLHALFTLPIFILMLTIAITNYGTFRLGEAAIKALFYVFLVLAGTQFFFVGDVFEFLLVLMSFGVIVTLGVLLFRTVQRETEARHVIEKQEAELEDINREQESLLHFISHEIKGYLTKSEAGFASIADGSFGPISSELKTMSESALGEMRKGVTTVMDILDASNLKKGTVSYKNNAFDFKTAVLEAIDELRTAAEEKGLSFKTTVGEGTFMITGDEHKLKQHAIRNLIDNAIKYTPKGTIRIGLARTDHKFRFSVEDNGVGITPEDMKNLFTEGGRGKDSIKINVHSTGYGLYIAKKIVEAHGGKIWAESEGGGKGSRFIVELPTA